MKRLVELLVAERLVLLVIIVNTLALIVMGYTDPQLAVTPNEQASVFRRDVYAFASAVDFGCVVYFVIEVALKIGQFVQQGRGFRGYWANGWHRFDFIIVVISMPVLFSSIVDIPDLSALLVLRIGRLFRLFRMMRFVPNQEHLYRGIKRALRASVGVFAALFLVNLILSIGATQLFGRYAPQYFGDPAISSYSLFRVFTIEGWYEIPDAVASASSAYVGTLARLYFMASVLAGGILGLSLANAVFVDEITMDNNEPLERKVDRLFDELAALRQQLASPSNESAEPNGSRRASGDDHE